jgi:aldehyde:ferredoxin oxidoreductase
MTGGLDLRWGDAKAITRLVKMMIAREGIGDLLADGSRAAARRLGLGSSAYAVQAGGQELAMHDGRNDPGFALHAVVEPMPGRHTNGAQLYYEMFQLWKRVPGLPKARVLYAKRAKYAASGKQADALAKAAVACSRFSQVLNGAGLCLFGAFIGVHRLPVFEWLNATTGWQEPPEGYMRAGARIQTLKQMFNARQGIPLRHAINLRAIGLPLLKHGANRGRTLDLDGMVRAYWNASGWDPETGIPGREAIEALGSLIGPAANPLRSLAEQPVLNRF